MIRINLLRRQHEPLAVKLRAIDQIELEVAAKNCGLSLPRYLAEFIETHVAELRAVRMEDSNGSRPACPAQNSAG